MPADEQPAWLVAWHAERGSALPQPSPPKEAPAPKPAPRAKRAPATPVRYRNKLTLLGIVEPDAWDYDGGKRREPVLDTDHNPPRIIRKVGWNRCLRCHKPFFSEDVVNLRLCGGAQMGCREDEDRFV